jgi:hypothetical protein
MDLLSLKDRSSEPNHGCALLDGDPVVIRHSHGQLAEVNFRIPVLEAVPKFPEATEDRTRFFRVIDQGRNSHQPADIQIRLLRRMTEQMFQLFWRASIFLLFPRNVYLKQDIEVPVFQFTAFLQGIDEELSFYRFHYMTVPGCVANLIRLQVTYEVDHTVRADWILELPSHVLNPVFTKMSHPCSIGCFNQVPFNRLAYRYQLNIRQDSAAALRGLRDAALNRHEVVCDTH